MEQIIINKEKYELINSIKKVNNCLMNCVDNFIEIGFRLEKIKNDKSYELIGYPSFDNFTSTEFKLGSTSVKNYISVSKKFGDEKTLRLKEKYSKYSLSQLVELLPVSDDIDSYSPALTTKEIRSKKIISQLTDYKKELIDYAVNYLKEHEEELHNKYPLVKYEYKLYRDGSSLYIERVGSYGNLLIINFYDGYYYFNYGEYIYDLSLENFKKLFERRLKIVFSKANKELLEEKEAKEKRKQEEIDKLPENEKGISVEERAIRVKQRKDEEEKNNLIKLLYKNKDYKFGYLDYYFFDEILTFKIYMLFNKVKLYNYPLIYKPIIFKTGEKFIGLINGMTHLRFFNDRIEEFDYESKEFKTILTIEEIKEYLYEVNKKFSLMDGSLFSLTEEKEKDVYLEDLKFVVNALNDKNNNLFKKE